MAKTKAQLHEEGQVAGVVPADSDPDDYTAEQLQGLVSGDIPVQGRESATKPLVAPDGHVVLSQEDIDNRA